MDMLIMAVLGLNLSGWGRKRKIGPVKPIAVSFAFSLLSASKFLSHT